MNYRSLIRLPRGRQFTLLAIGVAIVLIAQPQNLKPEFTYPVDEATDADLTRPVTWTTVANAQAYYLYVGTSFGAKDLVNTGGLQATSYLAAGLPSGQTLYARVWAQVGGVWRYTDSTFSAAAAPPVTPTLTYPANGAVNASLLQPITWTTVANAQAYYLYVGSSVGAKDLVNTGGLQTTSYLAAGLPSGPTLHARVWAQVGGVWRYTDSTFSAAAAPPVVATLTYPVNGAANADLTQPVTWTTVANAQAYYLYVGTTVGAKDLVNTGGLQATSYQAAGLPSGQTLYARVWAQVGGVWRYTDSTFSAAAAPPVTATLTYPANGAVNADLTQPIIWTTVANVQAYYLYVGTTVGAKDLVNTGGLQTTSFLAAGLPSGQTLYARTWAQVGGVWRYTDSTFSAAAAAPVTATLTYPVNSAADADLTQPITWTTVANAQAYYLYVGTSVGAKDLVNTGGLQTTSHLAAGLPSGQTLYARIWAQVGGVWRFTDSTFSAAAAAPVTATLTYPANGAVSADLLQPMTWTTVANAQAYYLYVGTSVGAKDVVNSGGLQATSYQAPELPSGQTLYARIWVQVGGVWRSTDSTFSALPLRATLTYPANGATDIDQTQPATWTTVPGAEAYYLYVGSTPGAKDFVNSYGTQSTSFPIAFLPAGQTLYARLWTKLGGTWRYRDSTFTASPIAPTLIYPTDGAVGITPAEPFRWTSPANAQAHQLLVGTSPGAADVFDSHEIVATSVSVPQLPTSGALYARVLSKVGGVWRHTDIAFTTESATPVSRIISPADGEMAFDTARPFEWQAVPLARGYRLTIGTTPGGADLHDSGEIRVTRRFVPALPIGTFFGRLQTKLNGQWHDSDFTFSVTANTISADLQIQSAFWATNVVRNMALIDNRPFTWTELADMIATRRVFRALCNDYAETLLIVLNEMNFQLPSRRLDVALNTNHWDAHTLAEVFNPDTQSWLLVDPTFDLTARRTDDGGWATAENVSNASRSQQFGDISYEFLSPLGDFYARRYYLDYPLLYLIIERQDHTWGPSAPVLPYMEPMAMPVSGPHGIYVIGCSGGDTTAVLMIDNVESVIDCSNGDGLSNVFDASVITPTGQTSPSVQIYRPKRFVF